MINFDLQIKYISADGKYTLQNNNGGLADFDYYAREEYEHQFLKIWDILKEHGLVQSDIADIENSDLFKYSPYKILTKDQQSVIDKVLHILVGYLKYDMEQSVLVEGGTAQALVSRITGVQVGTSIIWTDA